jgi:hypothetical protein
MEHHDLAGVLRQPKASEGEVDMASIKPHLITLQIIE